MADYRRWRIGGATYFFTVVTHDRRPFLTTPPALDALRFACRAVRRRFPFETIAIAVMPDHLHTIWKLPADDDRFSTRWRRIKSIVTHRLLDDPRLAVDRSRHPHRGGRFIWQRRFWEHLCRDDVDIERHADYIHGNPVKHGLVARPVDYRWSSFRRYVKLGAYAAEWGGSTVADMEGLE